MQEDPVNASDGNARFLSIYEVISASFDKSNPHHQNFVRCLDFIVSEGNTDKAKADIPAEIKTMICEAVQEILKEREPVPDPKLNPVSDSERKRSQFSLKLEKEWLPNLPKFMAVVPSPEPKPPVPDIKVQHEKTARPLSPTETAISPKHHSEKPSTSMVQPGEKRSTSVNQPSEMPSTNMREPDRRASLPVKNTKKGFFGRDRPKAPEEKSKDARKDQSKSY